MAYIVTALNSYGHVSARNFQYGACSMGVCMHTRVGMRTVAWVGTCLGICMHRRVDMCMHRRKDVRGNAFGRVRGHVCSMYPDVHRYVCRNLN